VCDKDYFNAELIELLKYKLVYNKMISFSRISEIWDDKGFEIVIGICLAFFLVLFIYRKCTGKTGTWNRSYYYNPDNYRIIKKSKRTPPKDSKGELECRRVLQETFKKPFNKDRPDFLRNPVTGGNFNLELDCYNPELKLAVEYSGQQHYKYIPFFHRNKDAFLNQKYRDEIKRRICKEQGITLIEVPYLVKEQYIESYLKKELRKKGYSV